VSAEQNNRGYLPRPIVVHVLRRPAWFPAHGSRARSSRLAGRDYETESEKVVLSDLRCHPIFYPRDATETSALQEASAG
jgi:hypothetical protein